MGVDIRLFDDGIDLRAAGEPVRETRYKRVNRPAGSFHKVPRQVFRILISHRDANRRGADAGSRQLGFVQFRMGRQRGAADNRVGLSKAYHMREGRGEAIEESLKRDSWQISKVDCEQGSRQACEVQFLMQPS